MAYTSHVRRIIETAVVVLALAGAGVGWWLGEERASAIVADRVAAGVPGTAEVTDVNFALRPRIYHSVDIRYGYAGRAYTGTLGWQDRTAGSLREGDQVEIFVDPTAPRRVVTGDGGASDGPLLLLPHVGVLLALIAFLAAAQVRLDGLGRVSRRAVSRSPAGGTVYRSTRFLAVLPGVTVVLGVAGGAALAPHPVSWAVALVGAGGGLWYLHTVVLGTNVRVRDGRLVVANPRQRAVVPLAEVTAITHDSAGTVVSTRDGGTIPVAAARQRDPADAQRQARRIVALADAQTERASGPVVISRNWCFLAAQTATLGAVAAGLGLLMVTAV
ncbi:DUF3592 domain-containing protein [Asanoa iriomotensis]|uniref:DUF3592 domain-containing protein n=1 Tax=Asanoa iriomotensis TaxID=234613 RepID=A0ABQ4CAQ7_9ACTN|nr:DUF3592 domain-containing protein [Asanoa iriomotensis]GIF59848.1 hypothetical protein Air01nite_59430 [Asanoa iriomotensis]